MEKDIYNIFFNHTYIAQKFEALNAKIMSVITGVMYFNFLTPAMAQKRCQTDVRNDARHGVKNCVRAR